MIKIYHLKYLSLFIRHNITEKENQAQYVPYVDYMLRKNDAGMWPREQRIISNII